MSNVVLWAKPNPTPQEQTVIAAAERAFGGYTDYRDGRYKIRETANGFFSPVIDEQVYTPDYSHSSGPGATFRSHADAERYCRLHIEGQHHEAHEFALTCRTGKSQPGTGTARDKAVA